MRFAPHLLALAFPLYTLGFVVTAPHAAWTVVPTVGVLVAAVALDAIAAPHRAPPPRAPAWLFDAVLYAAVANQLANVLGFAWVAGSMQPLDVAVGVLLVGMSSGYSAIVVAHELIHRPRAWARGLGRVLLGTVLYDHFAIEHVRGHHRRVGTADDPATARYGEALWPFLARTVPGQLASAWEIACRQLGDPALPLLDRRQLRNPVLQGLFLEWTVVLFLALALGPVAAIGWVLQAALAVLLLESVNYVEHWGIRRTGPRPSLVDSWDSESWFTYFTLVGLSRHADHHANAARPWQDLRHVLVSPKMPWGYWATVVCAILWNARLRARLVAILAATQGDATGRRADAAPKANLPLPASG